MHWGQQCALSVCMHGRCAVGVPIMQECQPGSAPQAVVGGQARAACRGGARPGARIEGPLSVVPKQLTGASTGSLRRPLSAAWGGKAWSTSRRAALSHPGTPYKRVCRVPGCILCAACHRLRHGGFHSSLGRGGFALCRWRKWMGRRHTWGALTASKDAGGSHSLRLCS